jgi:hypothetical protein
VLAVPGRRGQYVRTDSESRVPRAARGPAGGRLRRPGGEPARGAGDATLSAASCLVSRAPFPLTLAAEAA